MGMPVINHIGDIAGAFDWAMNNCPTAKASYIHARNAGASEEVAAKMCVSVLLQKNLELEARLLHIAQTAKNPLRS